MNQNKLCKVKLKVKLGSDGQLAMALKIQEVYKMFQEMIILYKDDIMYNNKLQNEIEFLNFIEDKRKQSLSRYNTKDLNGYYYMTLQDFISVFKNYIYYLDDLNYNNTIIEDIIFMNE